MHLSVSVCMHVRSFGDHRTHEYSDLSFISKRSNVSMLNSDLIWHVTRF